MEGEINEPKKDGHGDHIRKFRVDYRLMCVASCEIHSGVKGSCCELRSLALINMSFDVGG
jgi:hypothetical protein